MQVECDICNKLFKIKNKTKSHGVSVKETYFRCPHCKTKYVSFVMDSECRKLQKEIKELMKSKEVPATKLVNGEIDDVEYKNEIDKIDAKIKSKQINLKQKMDELKETYAK